MNLSNARQPGESFSGYRTRRSLSQKAIKAYLRRGTPATHTKHGHPYKVARNGQWYFGELAPAGLRAVHPLNSFGRVVPA
jgi:hypothetical protein